MTETKTIGSVASEILKNLHQKERKEGEMFYCPVKDIPWQRDIIFKAHLDRMPNDDMYERIYDILSAIEDVETEEEAQDRLYEMEADIYTYDLTKWLNNNVSNMYYLTEALEEGLDIKDGFQLLMYAQKKYIEEIGGTLISGILEHIENEP